MGLRSLHFDYNGIGRSLKKTIKELKTNAADWGSNDLESIIEYVIKNYPKSTKLILGHSIGGQLIGLAKSAVKLDKVILVAAQSGYWKHWRGIGRIKMWLNWHILLPILLNTFGYLNSKKINGMEDLPRNVANQWLNWCKNKDYILSDKSIRRRYYDKIEADLTAFTIENDDIAPLNAVRWLKSQYKSSKKKSIHLKPIDFNVKKIGHFGVFKESFRNNIWTQILNEIK